MEIFTVIHSLITGIALVVALFALRQANKRTPHRLNLRMTELETCVDRLAEWYKKLNANYALVVARSKRHPDKEPEPEEAANAFDMKKDETPEQWKKRMRNEMAAGRLHHT